MQHKFKIGGIAHYHSHQVLIRDVKLWKFYVFVFRFLSFSFQLGFYTGTKTVNKLFSVLMVSTTTYRICNKRRYSHKLFRTKLAEFWEAYLVIRVSFSVCYIELLQITQQHTFLYVEFVANAQKIFPSRHHSRKFVFLVK